MTEPGQGLLIKELLSRASVLKDEDGWEPLRPGVHIRPLYDCGEHGPAAALLRYQPGASIPHHEHLGYEHILVLDGAQSDEQGCYPAGTLVVNLPGSSHRVERPAGCVVLIIWERRRPLLGTIDPRAGFVNVVITRWAGSVELVAPALFATRGRH